MDRVVGEVKWGQDNIMLFDEQDTCYNAENDKDYTDKQNVQKLL